MEHDTTRLEASPRRAEARSRGKTRGSKEIPVYFHKGRLFHGPSMEGRKSRGVKVNKTSRIEISPNACFRSPCKYPRPRNEKADESRCQRELSQPLIRPSFVGRGILNIGGRGTFCDGRTVKTKPWKWWLLYYIHIYCSVQLFFVSFSSFWMRWMKIKKRGEYWRYFMLVIKLIVFVRIMTHLIRGRNNRSENDRAINGIIK